MNPNNSSPSNFELPAPEVGQVGAAPEFVPGLETAPAQGQRMPAQTQPAASAQATQPAQAPQPQAATTAPIPQVPTVADDADLIEKEWVEKAKAIVMATHSDPRAQNRELNKFKADYLQKRYNKAIKVDET